MVPGQRCKLESSKDHPVINFHTVKVVANGKVPNHKLEVKIDIAAKWLMLTSNQICRDEKRVLIT